MTMLEARSWAETSSFSGSCGLAKAGLRGFEGGVARLMLIDQLGIRPDGEIPGSPGSTGLLDGLLLLVAQPAIPIAIKPRWQTHAPKLPANESQRGIGLL